MVAVETSGFETPEEAVAALSHTAEDPELSPPAINGTRLYEKHVSPGKCSCDPSPLGREGQAPAGPESCQAEAKDFVWSSCILSIASPFDPIKHRHDYHRLKIRFYSLAKKSV